MTTVLNIKDTVYIGRRNPLTANSGYFGNPFIVGKDGSREVVLEKYKNYFYLRLLQDDVFKEAIEKLRGKILLCFCKPQACHGDIIKEYLDKSEPAMWRGEIG